MVSYRQIKAVRSYLEQDQKTFAEGSDIAISTLRKIEQGMHPKENSLAGINRWLDAHGVKLNNNDSYDVIDGQVTIYKGRSGFTDFVKDIFITVKVSGGVVMVDNVSEDVFGYWLGNEEQAHIQRMGSLKNFKSKILIKQGDKNHVASDYAEYRYVDPKRFGKITYYIYGNKRATIIFEEDDVRVYVMRDKHLTDLYKEEFYEAWERAEPV